MAATRPRRNLMDEKQLKAWLLRQMGAPQVAVELHPADLDDFIEDAKDWFISNKGIARHWKTPVLSGQVEYPVPDDVDAVLDVYLPGSRYDLRPYYDPAALGLYTLPADFVVPRGEFNINSGVYQRIQYFETSQRVFSVEPDWIWDEVERAVILTPPPTTAGDMIVVYRATSLTLDQMTYHDFEFIKRYMVAKAKLKLSRVRVKHPSFPGVQSDRSLDGENLGQEGKEELEKLDEEIRKSAMPAFLVTG